MEIFTGESLHQEWLFCKFCQERHFTSPKTGNTQNQRHKAKSIAIILTKPDSSSDCKHASKQINVRTMAGNIWGNVLE